MAEPRASDGTSFNFVTSSLAWSEGFTFQNAAYAGVVHRRTIAPKPHFLASPINLFWSSSFNDRLFLEWPFLLVQQLKFRCAFATILRLRDLGKLNEKPG
jgi:hypothetical protein